MRSYSIQSASKRFITCIRSKQFTSIVSSARSFSSASAASSVTVLVNGRQYALPQVPTAVIVIDGGSEEYLASARSAGAMPFLSSLLSTRGVHGLVTTQVPTLTNPNNCAIVCGASAAVTGISGNYFVDEKTGAEVMMNSPEYLRCPTIFSALERAGTPITILTAKDKLLGLLSHQLQSALCISIETLGKQFDVVNSTIHSRVGVDVHDLLLGSHYAPVPPPIYSEGVSLYLLELGLKLMQQAIKSHKAPLFYLSTTDYMQHKSQPGSSVANSFYAEVDRILCALDKLGVALVMTADHGMNDKIKYPSGQPNVTYLSTILDSYGLSSSEYRVILPITDPYITHHGSLGGYACIYLTSNKAKERAMEIMQKLRRESGVYSVMNRADGAHAFDLPPDRIGDILVFATQHAVLGKSQDYHDLSSVPHLRSHGGIDEATVPMVLNFTPRQQWSQRLFSGKARNYHAIDMVLNGRQTAQQQDDE